MGFPHMLFMVHPEYRPKRPANQFVPRLYGFKIHHHAYQIQQQAAANFKAPMRTAGHLVTRPHPNLEEHLRLEAESKKRMEDFAAQVHAMNARTRAAIKQVHLQGGKKDKTKSDKPSL